MYVFLISKNTTSLEREWKQLIFWLFGLCETLWDSETLWDCEEFLCHPVQMSLSDSGLRPLVNVDSKTLICQNTRDTD